MTCRRVSGRRLYCVHVCKRYLYPQTGMPVRLQHLRVAGVPVVTVPTTRLPGPPRPASLAFIGRKYDEAKLLALAYDYEQATQLRIVPDLP